MDLVAESAELRRDLSTRRKRERFSPELAARIRAHVAARRRLGTTMLTLSEELGVALDTLYRWQREQPRGSALRRVEVVGEQRVVVHGPCGVRVEGLDLDALAKLLRKLS